MNDRVRVRRGVNGVGWVVVINSAGDWFWYQTWNEAINAADGWVHYRGDRRRWTGGA